MPADEPATGAAREPTRCAPACPRCQAPPGPATTCQDTADEQRLHAAGERLRTLAAELAAERAARDELATSGPYGDGFHIPACLLRLGASECTCPPAPPAPPETPESR